MNTQLHILLVEDDEIDIEFIQRTLKPSGAHWLLTVAGNGKQALELLKSQSSDRRISPWLILLDLQMPLMGGIEFLQLLRNDPVLQSMVVFVLTTSDLDVDRQAVCACRAAGYLLKSDIAHNPGKLLDLLEAYRVRLALPNQ